MSAHNAYVEALFQTGVVGGALIAVLVVMLVYPAAMNPSSDSRPSPWPRYAAIKIGRAHV